MNKYKEMEETYVKKYKKRQHIQQSISSMATTVGIELRAFPKEYQKINPKNSFWVHPKNIGVNISPFLQQSP
jgi:hypothetical protein